MEKVEARQLLAAEIASLRALSYEELRMRVDAPQARELTADSGAWYQIETLVWWDGKPGGDLRVLASIDDGGWRTYMPLGDGFIKAPDGTFVDE